MVTAFLLLGGEDEVQFTQEEWDAYFETAKGLAAADPKNYPEWSSH